MNVSVGKLIARLKLPWPVEEPEPGDVRRVLVYGSMGIGNMVMFTPALQALRALYPRAHFTMLVRGQGAEHVVAHGNLVDEIIHTRRNRREMLALTRRLRQRRYDLLVSTFHGGPFRLVTAFAGVPWRLGHVSSGGWHSRYDYLFNLPVPMADGEHEVERYMRLPRRLGYSGPTPPPVFHLSPADDAAAAALLARNNVRPDDLLVGVQLDSSQGTAWRRWPLERFGTVCRALVRDHGARIVVLGSVRTMDDAAVLPGLLGEGAILGVEELPIGPAAAVVRRCALTICNDSGFMHISGALGVPTVGLLGPTDHTRTSPLRYGPQHRLIRHDVPCGPCYGLAGADTAEACGDRICLSRITPEEVLAVAGEVIATRRAAPATIAGSATHLAT